MGTGNVGGVGPGDTNQPGSTAHVAVTDQNTAGAVKNLGQDLIERSPKSLAELPQPSHTQASNNTEVKQSSYWKKWMDDNKDNSNAERVFNAIQQFNPASAEGTSPDPIFADYDGLTEYVEEQDTPLNLGDCTGLDIDFSQLPEGVNTLILKGLPSNLDFSSMSSLNKLDYRQGEQSAGTPLPTLKLPEQLIELKLSGLKEQQVFKLPEQLRKLECTGSELNDKLPLPRTLTTVKAGLEQIFLSERDFPKDPNKEHTWGDLLNSSPHGAQLTNYQI